MECLAQKILSSLFFLLIFINFEISKATPTNQRNLNLQNCSETDFSNIDDAKNVGGLHVSNCYLTTLKNDTFKSFDSLSVLNITDSKLQRLQNSTLHGLKRLRILSLARNNISVIENWSSKPLIVLNKLDLQQNNIKSLQNDCFTSFPNLQSLDLSENLLETLNNNGFAKLPFLKNLSLAGNRLSSLNNSAFKELERLTYLKLSDNELKEIDAATFESNTHLHTLKLEYNQLRSLEFLKPKSLQRLIFLNLTKNRISQIDAESFKYNLELVTLDLSWNLLTELNHSFSGLRSLEHLNISNNQLHTVAPLSFKELNILKEIDLSHNNLSTISGTLFEATPLLELINLAQNKLATISEKLFTPLPFLTNINVSGNKLSNATFIAYFATALPHSELTLDLSNNLFQDTTLNMTKLSEFARVELAGNHWSCLWLISKIATSPSSLHFGYIYEVTTNAWNNDMHNFTSFDCYDDQRKRNIIMLPSLCDVKATQESEKENLLDVNACKETTLITQNLSPPPLVWPKIRMDKFDSRSVIIWMLIAIAIAFAGLRVARHLMEEKDERSLFRRFKHQQSDCTEMETLHSPDESIKNSEP